MTERSDRASRSRFRSRRPGDVGTGIGVQRETEERCASAHREKYFRQFSPRRAFMAPHASRVVLKSFIASKALISKMVPRVSVKRVRNIRRVAGLRRPGGLNSFVPAEGEKQKCPSCHLIATACAPKPRSSSAPGPRFSAPGIRFLARESFRGGRPASALGSGTDPKGAAITGQAAVLTPRGVAHRRQPRTRRQMTSAPDTVLLPRGAGSAARPGHLAW